MTKVNLIWHPLTKFDSINLEDHQELLNIPKKNNPYSGVYIWGFNLNEKFIPYYVGVSDNVFNRIFEHLGALLGGAYTIYNKKSLKNFKEYKEKAPDWNIDNPLSSNEVVYYPRDIEAFKWFYKNRTDISEHIDFMYSNFVFTYAFYKSEQGVSIYNIEKKLISHIGKDNLGNIRGGNPKDGFTLINKTKNSTDKELNKLISLLNKSDNV